MEAVTAYQLWLKRGFEAPIEEAPSQPLACEDVHAIECRLELHLIDREGCLPGGQQHLCRAGAEIRSKRRKITTACEPHEKLWRSFEQL